MNDSIDSLNGFEILLQQSQELEHGLQLVHTWSYWSDIFHDGYRYILTNIYGYFYDNAIGRRFDFICKAGEAACVDQQQQWLVPFIGPLWSGNKLNFQHLMSSYHLALTKFDLKQDQSVFLVFMFFCVNSKLVETSACDSPSYYHKYKFSLVPVYGCDQSGLCSAYSAHVPYVKYGLLFYTSMHITMWYLAVWMEASSGSHICIQGIAIGKGGLVLVDGKLEKADLKYLC
ncbi:hypothetical protein KIW84_043844 [Lathyrus oleraceus]|uniref:Snurportin-1 n=1 Tax=Pisum sativum TaxID=3888 RepID=A0A9D4XG96_PEA|nr:hypothetical protein KIW84_043844 [Pisum sativum]